LEGSPIRIISILKGRGEVRKLKTCNFYEVKKMKDKYKTKKQLIEELEALRK